MTALEPWQQPDRLPDWVRLLEPVAILSERLASTEFVPKAMRRRPEAVAAAILYGHELGLGPMQALAGIDVVDGNPTPNAELMRALVLRAGHDLRVAEASNTKVTMVGRRKGSPDTTSVTWTLDMARTAGLAGKQNWRQYPRAMLTARATTELVRLLFPDAVGGLSHLSEELDTPEPDGGEAELVGKPAPAAGRRRPPTIPRAVSQSEPPELPSSPSTPDQPPTTPETVSAPPEGPPLPGEPGYDDEPPTPDTNGVTEAQLKKLHTVLTKLEVTDRADRLVLVAGLIGRDIDSSKDLTRDEASHVIDQLEHDGPG